MAKKKTTNPPQDEELIVIDQDKDLVFSSEQEVLEHFNEEVAFFENEFLGLRKKGDFTDEESVELELQLEELLQNPDEIWEDTETLEDMTVYNFIKVFEQEDESFFYVAVGYLAGEIPTFIFLHFPTRHEKTCEYYRKGELVYDRSQEDIEHGGIEGDALTEGDSLALGLYKAMLTVRSESDISESLFQNYAEMREETIEEADEIWRNTTLAGYTLVTFIKDFSRMDGSSDLIYYIAVTVEDAGTNSHALLFSFPSSDESLVDRYRHGENLQADEVIQESSH